MANIYKSILGKSMGLLGVAMLLLCFSNSGFAQLSGNLTVDKTAAASATNFTSFQSLFTALSSQGVNGAVTVDVSNGPYTEQVQANAISGVSSTNTITINGNGQVLQFTSTSSANRHTIRFNGADWVTLKNLTVRALGTTYGWGIRYYNNANDNTVDGCTIEVPNITSGTSSNSVGIVGTNSNTSAWGVSNNCSRLTVMNSTITGGANNGPYFGINIQSSTSEATATNNIFRKNVIKNFRYYGIRIRTASGTVMDGNEIYRDNGYNFVTTTIAIEIERSRNTTVTNNNIHALFHNSNTNTFYGIYYDFNSSSIGSHSVNNNAIYDVNSRSTWYGIWVRSTRNVDVYQNTIVHDNITSPAFGTQRGIWFSTSYSGRNCRNNIVKFDFGGTTTRVCMEHDVTTLNVNNNAYYVTGTNGFIANRNNTNYRTMALWQAATGGGAPFDADGVSADPMFVGTTNINDLKPRSIALDDLGANVGVANDYGGNVRGADPDPGIWEFTVDANVTAITSTGGVLSCQGEDDEIEVTIKNNASFDISGFNVTYVATGANAKTVSEPFTGSIGAGQSATFKFAEKLTFTNTGTTDIDAYIGKKPSFGPYSIVTNPSPIGAEFAKGSTYTGTFLTGNNTDPDIAANPDEVNYELNPPTGFNNADYGTTWNISTYTVTTAKGATVPAGDLVRTNPVGTSPLNLRFRPSAGLTDDTLIVNIAAFSIATQCEAPVLDRFIFVAPRPVADFNALDVCENLPVQFVNASTISTGTISYDWEFGDGSISDFADFNKTYNGFGSYTVKLTVESNYGYTDVITKTVEVFEAPTIEFGFDNKCEGNAIPFTNTSSTPNGPLVNNWNFGDGNSSTAVAPSHLYANTGTYSATLTITDAKGCISKETKTVTYSKKPTADFTAPTLVCNENDVTFTNTSIEAGSTGYTWDFGNSTFSQTKDGSVKYTNAGTFDVKLTALNDFGCEDIKTQSITITEAPVADFAISGSCIGDPVSFTNNTSEPSGATTTYEWYFGEDGATSTTKDDSYIYNSVGEYEIILKAEADNGCGTEKTTLVTFGEKPVVDFTLPAKACEGEDVFITNSSVVSTGSLTNTWDLGNGTSSANNPTANYTTAGTYTVSLTAESGIGCSASKTRDITINSIPNSDFNFESAKTGDGRMTFTPIAPNGIGDYKWIYGDGSTSTETAQHNFVYTSSVGLFKVTLIINNDGCVSTTTKDVSINVLGVNNIAEGKLKVYPNPTAGVVSVDVENNIQVSKLQVVDMLGKVVAAQNANSATSTYNFDLTAQSAGIYFVQIHTANGIYSKKITVSK